jgi:hypothetical protein
MLAFSCRSSRQWEIDAVATNSFSVFQKQIMNFEFKMLCTFGTQRLSWQTLTWSIAVDLSSTAPDPATALFVSSEAKSLSVTMYP